jgi:hypothetical protein
MTTTLINNINSDFILRTLKTTGIVLLFCLAFGTVYFGFYDALAFFSAGIWSMVSLLLLSGFIRTVLNPDGVDKIAALGMAIIKFPLLYVAGYFLFTTRIFRPLPMILGFSLLFVIIVLKAVGIAIFHLDVFDKSRGSDAWA